jgi:hypothetical protein
VELPLPELPAPEQPALHDRRADRLRPVQHADDVRRRQGAAEVHRPGPYAVRGDQPDRRRQQPPRPGAAGRGGPRRPYANLYGSVSAFAVGAGTNGQLIWAGTDTGKLWKTSDGGAHWTQQQGVPSRWVNAVVSDATNPDHAYAAFSGYREGDNSASVYETTDGGRELAQRSFNLPNAPVEMITYDSAHNVLFAATDYGVFERKDGDSTWYNAQGRPAEHAGARRQAQRRRQVAVRGDVRPQHPAPAALDERDHR